MHRRLAARGNWTTRTMCDLQGTSLPLQTVIGHREEKSTEGNVHFRILSLLEIFSTLHASKRHQPNQNKEPRLFLHPGKTDIYCVGSLWQLGWAGRWQGQGAGAQALPWGQAVPASWSPDTERGQKGVSGQLPSSRATCGLHPPPPGQVWLGRHLGEPGQPCGLHAFVGYGPSSAFGGLRSTLTRCLWAQSATARALTGPLLL